MIGDTIALLDRDDGDSWLSERDFVFYTLHVEVARGRVADLPGRKLDVIRARSFSKLKQQLEEAGYGRFDRTALFDARVRKACREFQRDRGLAATGVPDQATRALLLDFLEGLRNPVAPGEGGTTP